MDTSDVTIEILKEIRDEVRENNVRVTRVETGLADVSRRIVESEIRTSTAIADLAGTVREMTTVLRAQHDLRPRMDRCERDIAELQRKVGEG